MLRGVTIHTCTFFGLVLVPHSDCSFREEDPEESD